MTTKRKVKVTRIMERLTWSDGRDHMKALAMDVNCYLYVYSSFDGVWYPFRGYLNHWNNRARQRPERKIHRGKFTIEVVDES